MQLLRFGGGHVLEVRMGRPDRTRDPINLAPASVNARPRVVEHAVLGEDVIDGRSSARGVALAEYLVEIARQQGRDAVGHGRSPIALGKWSGSAAVAFPLTLCVLAAR